MRNPIISTGEALQILANDLRKKAMKEHAAELKTASGPERERLLKQVEEEIKKKIRARKKRLYPGAVLY